MLAAWTLRPVSVNPAAGPGSRSKARTKNEAIWARVTELLGQNRNGPVPQPAVTPNSARRSVYGPHHTPAATSANRDPAWGDGFVRSNTRTSHTAISQRCNASLGHNPPSQPVPSKTVGNLARRASTAGWCTPASSTDNSAGRNQNRRRTPTPQPGCVSVACGTRRHRGQHQTRDHPDHCPRFCSFGIHRRNPNSTPANPGQVAQNTGTGDEQKRIRVSAPASVRIGVSTTIRGLCRSLPTGPTNRGRTLPGGNHDNVASRLVGRPVPCGCAAG